MFQNDIYITMIALQSMETKYQMDIFFMNNTAASSDYILGKIVKH